MSTAPTPLARYLDLIEPERDSLVPDPERDAHLYVDLDGLVDRCLGRLAARAPKLVLMGDYGTGKTHLLHVLMDRVDKARFEPVYARLQPFGRFSESKHLHGELLRALEEGGRLDLALAGAGPAHHKDLQNAVDRLRDQPGDPVARAWLAATGPSPAKALAAGFSAPLAQ